MLLSAEDQKFQSEIRQSLTKMLSDELRSASDKRSSGWQDLESSMTWQRILNSKGWAAPDWPKEYGGTGWTLSQRYIFSQECVRAKAPALIPMSLRMCGPMLIGHGTAEQKAHYLPRILSGDDIWCQGYSEPGSGSDLASLSTMAVSNGDDYIVNGTKIWTSYAQHANMMFALVRTSKKGKQQQGISFLLIDMDTPGITVKPIINIAGAHELNQVFFDDVRVPKVNRVAEENEGWTVAKYLLEFERFSMGSIELRRTLDRVEKLAAETVVDGKLLSNEAEFKQKLATLTIETMILEASEQRVLSKLSAGKSPGAASSLQKLHHSELVQRADELGAEVLGYYAAPHQPEALDIGTNVAAVGPENGITFMPMYLSNRMKTIAGGSSEVLRNVAAKTILGL